MTTYRHILTSRAVVGLAFLATAIGFAGGLSVPRATPADAAFRPAPQVGTVTTHPGQVHLVTPDGVLYIVPTAGDDCVRVALPSADFAECVAG